MKKKSKKFHTFKKISKSLRQTMIKSVKDLALISPFFATSKFKKTYLNHLPYYKKCDTCSVFANLARSMT